MKRRIEVSEFKKILNNKTINENVEYRPLDEFDLDGELEYIKKYSTNKHAVKMVNKNDFVGWFNTKYNKYGYLFFRLSEDEKNILNVNDSVYRVLWEKGTTVAKINFDTKRIMFADNDNDDDRNIKFQTPIKADNIAIYK